MQPVRSGDSGICRISISDDDSDSDSDDDDLT